MGIKNKENFRYYYKLEAENNRCPCGPGSDPDIVKQFGTIVFIEDIVRTYRIKSISDCPCGLFENWIHMVDLTNVNYSGYDINDLAIERNKKNNPGIPFFEFDLVNEILPATDIIICRDCFFHLSTSFVLSALENFRASGSTYLLTTNHPQLSVNGDLNAKGLAQEAGFRFINLEISPFNLGRPIETHDEEVSKYVRGGNDRQLSLWRL